MGDASDTRSTAVTLSTTASLAVSDSAFSSTSFPEEVEDDEEAWSTAEATVEASLMAVLMALVRRPRGQIAGMLVT